MSAFSPAAAASRLVPTFDESDVDGSFKAFERVANHNEWPEDQWASLLVPKLAGKAYRVYNSLSDPDNYAEIKRSISNADGYRQQLRNYTKLESHTFVEFASEKLKQLKKWLEATKSITFSELLNVIVMEEWKNKLPFNILRHVEEQGKCELMQVAKVADGGLPC